MEEGHVTLVDIDQLLLLLLLSHIFHLDIIDEQLVQFLVTVLPPLQHPHTTAFRRTHVACPLLCLLHLRVAKRKR